MIRAFLAIDVPPDYRAGMAEVQEVLKKSGADVRWVSPANIHLTLKFFGDISDSQVEAITSAAAAIAAATSAFQLQAQGVGTFPNAKNPRVVWLGLGGQTDVLAELVQHLEDALLPLGFPAEKRRFTPHLTLGRVHSGRGRQELQRQLENLMLPAFQEFTVTKMVLYQSTLRPQGAVYTPLRQIGLEIPEELA
ncbi:MAG: RNA 2',3'-cyclic phosphodiesterase [Desulfobacca sp.]|uniref:RNA 2',3'-cyclic phosphodiesterase n=1 Tax=Desulfobacca sp. TaxID=2067990 RepID=UPI004049232A